VIHLILAILAGLLAALVRPGVNVLSRDNSPPATAPSDTGVAFAVVITERGRTDQAFKVNSFSDFRRRCGARMNWTALAWDSAEAFFRFGGSELWLSRLVGPAAVKASVNLLDNAAGISLVARAVGEGDWYNGLNVTVEASGANRRVRVTHDTDLTISETSPYYATQAELVTWAEASEYVRLEIGASALMPVAVVASLAGGTDDRAAIADAQRTASLAKFSEDLGPGQVTIPGATTQTAWTAVLTHASQFRRNAILDYPDTPTEATLTTLANAVRALGSFGAGFAGWLRMAGSDGFVKVVPPSLAVCGLIAAHDSATNGWGQNKPVAGRKRGVFRRALGVTQGQSATWRDKDAVTRLNAAGVNLIRERYGVTMVYGWRSLADPAVEPNWVNFGHRRLSNAITAKAENVMEDYVFDEIDGERRLFGKVNGELTGRVMEPYYLEGSLYGATAQEAYRIDTDSVNTDTTIQNRELHATITFVPSEFAEEITLEFIQNQITQGVDS
jgi:hypothetical protein